MSGLRGDLEMVVSIVRFLAEVGPTLIWVILLLPVGWFFWRRWLHSYRMDASALV